MRAGGRHSRGKDETDLCASLQQARVPVTAPGHARPHRVGHRPVSNLQGCEYYYRVSAGNIIFYGIVLIMKTKEEEKTSNAVFIEEIDHRGTIN